jgi:3D (Asp-Asp-Asp) domain-containing protein
MMRNPFSDWRRHPLRIILPLTLLFFLSGGSVYYWHSNSVRLTADGKTRRIFTDARDVQAFLQEQKIVLGPKDFTTPDIQAPIGHKTAVKITRVTMDTEVQVSTSPPVTTWQNRTRDNLRRVLILHGYSTIVANKYDIVRHDGIEISRTLKSEKKGRQPFYTLTLFDKSGQPSKTYNLLKCKMLKMRSTGYYLGEKTVPSTVTYLGYKFQHGLVAVDPKVIKLGSRLYVEGYGYAYAADTGSAIKGLRIDLAVKDKYEEVRCNRHDVPVYILEKSKRW